MRKVIHPDFPEYFVRDDGLVERRVPSKHYQKVGRVIMGRMLISGYVQFKLNHRSGRKQAVRANRLVAEAFHGMPPSADHVAAHENGIRADNRPENLRWATQKDNVADSIRHGTHPRGERAGGAKLTAAAVAQIRSVASKRSGEFARLARMFGVNATCIRKAAVGETWAHLPNIKA